MGNFQTHMAQQAQFEQAYEQFEANAEIYRLKKELDIMKAENANLKKEVDIQHKAAVRGLGDKLPSYISGVKIDEFVTKLMADPDTNIAMIPDFIERPAQRNFFFYLMKTFAHTLDSGSVSVLGHKITFHMEPEEQPSLDEEDDNDKENSETF